MTVAWEMHVRHDFLVPSLNFKPYTQKPPLLAWLINLGWLLAGYHRFIATLITSAFSFGCIAWIYAIARRLWPDNTQRATQAAWLGFGSVIMQVYGTLVFYDVMLTCFVLGCVYMMIQSANTGRMRYTLGLGLFLGLAGLSKGPAVLVHILPLALLAPVWRSTLAGTWRGWYGKLLLAVLIGFAMGFGWAIPAALQGGHDYAKWILLQQTTKRVVKAFNHAEPWWFYFMVAPIMLLPWLFVPSVWQNLVKLKQIKTDTTLRFLLCWIIPVFAIFSAFSGKQLHYLLPLWPAFILLIVNLLPTTLNKRDLVIASFPFLLIGIVWSVVVILADLHLMRLPPLWQDMLLPYPWLPAVYTVTIALLLGSNRLADNKPAVISLMMWLTLVVVHVTAAPQGFERFSAEAVSQALLAHPNRPLAAVAARYQGDVNYLSRITQPVKIIPPNNDAAVADFLNQHPDGIVLQQVRDPQDVLNDQVTNDSILFVQRYRTKRFYVLTEKKP